ncbi:MAG: CoB--CoM heterodisulfide reductase iron-sulfur subunit B family protein [Prevotellaceae bacterium]|jgi:heterodisulfide reductase subunit B|nr:CoB--CoM heterodisulfide reductase iron-sulfur subunit B family protein [Prevotellaceae bacterium]
MEIGFYPGCSLSGTSSDYAQSTLALAKAFGITPVELSDWNCCGATAAHNLNHELALALPARILAQAERQGMDELLVPCAACYNRLSVAQHALSHDAELKRKLEDKLQAQLGCRLRVLNVMQFIDKYVAAQLSAKACQPFARKVACYYGCLLVRPHDVLQFDRVEDPQSMDELMRSIGATSLDWGFKTECCGAGFSVSRTDVVAELSGKILRDAADRGAEAIIVACPMCQANLDMRRPHINRYLQQKISIPVLYITQAIGLALGISPKELGLHKLFVEAKFLSH